MSSKWGRWFSFLWKYPLRRKENGAEENLNLGTDLSAQPIIIKSKTCHMWEHRKGKAGLKWSIKNWYKKETLQMAEMSKGLSHSWALIEHHQIHTGDRRPYSYHECEDATKRFGTNQTLNKPHQWETVYVFCVEGHSATLPYWSGTRELTKVRIHVTVVNVGNPSASDPPSTSVSRLT